MNPLALPLIGVCAFSGTGKTTLLTKLIPVLKRRELRIGIIKHAHHEFEIDQPGKDSYELRKAGADQVGVASRKRIAWILENSNNADEPVLLDALAVMQTDDLDLVIAEGFKQEAFPKIELHRPSLGKPLLCTLDKSIIALATDSAVESAPDLPVLDLNDINAIANFIVAFVDKHNRRAPDHAA